LRSENHQARSSDALFFLKKVDDLFSVVALKTGANAADCFTVKPKQIKRSDMVTFLLLLSLKAPSGVGMGKGYPPPQPIGGAS